MRLIERTLQLVILILTIIVGLLIIGSIPDDLSFKEQKKIPKPKSQPIVIEESLPPSSFSQIISRLSLVPFLKSDVLPVAIVIENHEGARPHQRGLEDALMIQEHMVEGFISRFVAIYNNKNIPEIVGPVRSLRPYFIDAIAPLTGIFLHAGGSPEALDKVASDSDLYSINGLYHDDKNNGGEYFRINGIPAPHDLFTGIKSITPLLPEDIDEVKWPPYKTGNVQSGSGAKAIKVNFFNPLHNVSYAYQWGTKTYKRTNGGVISSAEPSNVLILEMPIKGAGEFGRLDIDMVGRGKIQLFRSGKMIEGLWHKEALGSFFTFEDLNGEELNFARGQVWMMFVPSLGRVSFEG
ncbi:DUF3048 domain-containing protein [Patescibacteria group bacterium]|nr:DUF3048 domain-containing protein [Patescibacteria group bacterium]MBU1123831.1 DUF3048 domain-containing protein [Patescibacteria group bacterium]MBU1911148.1 DUF3048 domain-containing protein [Patescibacteria group bacterium]